MIVAVLATLAAPVLAYTAIRNAAIDAAGSAADPTSVMLPRSMLPQVKATMRVARDPEKRLPARAQAVARRAAVALPLAYEPFYIQARLAEQAGRYDRATVLMEEARRRRPNATAVHVALLGYYSLQNAYQQAIDEADFAMRVNYRSRTLILPAFAKLVALDPKARQAIAVALSKNPPWRGDFLNAATTAAMAPVDAKALVADIRRLRPVAKPDLEEQFLLRTLAASGRYQEAHALWRSYGPASAPTANMVVDPSFGGEPVMAPFGWTFTSGQDGTAEIAKASAGDRASLEVDYFGDTGVALAEQTLAAAPGSYRLSAQFSGNSNTSDIRLVWDLLCLPGGAPLARLLLQPLGDRPIRRETTLSIPAKCNGQQLRLVGEPGDLSRTLRAQIFNVALVPAAAGRQR